MKVGMAIKTQLDGCPMANRLSRQVVTLLRYVKRAEKLSDLPDMKKVEQWWNRKNFQPWAEEEETELVWFADCHRNC